MPEIRTDRVTGRSVILADRRAKRPIEIQRVPFRKTTTRCPFCRGNEQDTPTALATYLLSDSKDTSDWQVRVVPNKYPALDETANNESNAAGIHEVIIESPTHATCLAEVTSRQCILILRAYRDRLVYAAQKPNLNYGIVFKNAGAGAGASIEHLHSQLMATELIPPDVNTMVDHAQTYFSENSNCVTCDVLEEELSDAARVVESTENFVAFCPFASRFSYETWIVPRRHTCRFENSDDAELSEIAMLLQRMVSRLKQTVDQLTYNIVWYTAPFSASDEGFFHWRVEIVPRVSGIAGFELGSGCFVNSISPEHAADQLRGPKLDSKLAIPIDLGELDL